jgi:hypothetical protein
MEVAMTDARVLAWCLLGAMLAIVAVIAAVH